MNQKIQDLEAKLEATEKEREEYIRKYAVYAALWSESTREKVTEYTKKILDIQRQIKAEKSKKNSKLRPCKWCGGKGKWVAIPDEKLVGIECTNCYIGTGLWKTQEEAISKWNGEITMNNGIYAVVKRYEQNGKEFKEI